MPDGVIVYCVIYCSESFQVAPGYPLSTLDVSSLDSRIHVQHVLFALFIPVGPLYIIVVLYFVKIPGNKFALRIPF